MVDASFDEVINWLMNEIIKNMKYGDILENKLFVENDYDYAKEKVREMKKKGTYRDFVCNNEVAQLGNSYILMNL